MQIDFFFFNLTNSASEYLIEVWWKSVLWQSEGKEDLSILEYWSWDENKDFQNVIPNFIYRLP